MSSVGGSYGQSRAAPVSSDAFPRPPRQTLPLSKGGDLLVDFLQMIDGVYENYDSGVTVTLVIDTVPPIVAVASVSAYHAECQVDSAVTDDVPENIPWRCVVSYPTTPTSEVVAMNGLTARADS